MNDRCGQCPACTSDMVDIVPCYRAGRTRATIINAEPVVLALNAASAALKRVGETLTRTRR